MHLSDGSEATVREGAGVNRVPRILIGDHEAAVREQVRLLLESRRDFDVCGEADAENWLLPRNN